jgi:hypothetical protein
VTAGPQPFVQHGRAARAQVIEQNRFATACATGLPTVSVGLQASGGMPFPAATRTVRIPGHGRLVITGQLLVTGSCRAAEQGMRINVSGGGWTYSLPLGVAGCSLRPLRMTYRVVG